jgi:hypothetical protein
MLNVWLRPKVLLGALAVSVVLVVVGGHLLPLFSSVVFRLRVGNVAVLLQVGTVLLASMLIAFALAVMFEAVNRALGRERQIMPFGKACCRLWMLLLGFAVVFFFISLLYGLLAVGLYKSLKTSLSWGQIMGVINAVTVILTVAVLPLVLNVLFTLGLTGMKFWGSVVEGLRLGKNRYFLWQIFPIVAFAVGWLLVLPFRYFELTPLLSVFKDAVTVFTGVFGLVFGCALFVDGASLGTVSAGKREVDAVEDSTG